MSTLKNDNLTLKENYDYAHHIDEVTGKHYLDIKVKEAWDRYARFRRGQGETPLFRNEYAFMAGLGSHPAAVQDSKDSPLRRGSMNVKLFRYDLQMLYEEFQVDEFENISATKLFPKKD